VPNGEAGTPTSIQIGLLDEFGNPLAGAKDQIRVSVAGANTENDAHIEETGGGSYVATYTPTHVGTDQVTVTVGDQPLVGAPFPSSVAAGPGDPGQTTADVPRDVGLFNRNENPVDITIRVADHQGNPLGRGGDQVIVTVKRGNDVVATPDVIDHGDGTYTARWTAQAQDNYKVVITLNGIEIKDSPFSVRVSLF
jgi:hypothetical protein